MTQAPVPEPARSPYRPASSFSLTRPTGIAPEVLARLRSAVRDSLALDQDVPVMITELVGRQAGAATLETVVSVLRPRGPLSRTLDGSATDLTASDICLAFTGSADGTA